VATILIIGASRGIGLETVKAALEAGHSVRALARSARRIRFDHPKLEKMAGDDLGIATVKRAKCSAFAADQGYANAQSNVGLMCSKEGVMQDYGEAEKMASPRC
jgi:NAD(P)-dependent dehydrogenase (short-subunit alcohol dehydrogenase family)